MNNYHTHTSLCHHADGSVIDYAREARRLGMRVLGMSDHAPLPDSKWPGVRMSYAELGEYERQIHDAREEVQDITILKGLECEWAPAYKSFFTDDASVVENTGKKIFLTRGSNKNIKITEKSDLIFAEILMDE